jgi:starvation-inducible DNA-binding protein
LKPKSWEMPIAIKKVASEGKVTPRWHAHAKEIQKFGSVVEDMSHPLSAEMTAKLNQLFADSISLRDMYKKHHWQVSGPTF